ncbi:type IV conjugative transfer system protein TraE [Vibrio furnissii]|uniref:type IV conjugative transfer system protein TraE n=1 Tax=Vibrio furnissii TaxID=29494 RepID=UPI001C9C77CD|nr:type IV conjugative transfer system protein TraE [Vibrio furnissii]MBY7933084.1 type IV conjugative transfer system protein TraE [Vibrio fluvialis]MCG6230258.1 type IV conjugative transfer system protein TraE [Vibrio furnissii]MCG6268457.1 type IV conjugative transfer system protein TraE [Vibrio furnissii]
MNADIHAKLMELSKSFRRTLIIGVGLSGIVSLCLGGGLVYMSLFNTYTRIVPPTIQKEMTLGRGYVDEEYLSEIAEYAVYLRNNVTPDTVSKNFGQLLKMAVPDKWGELRGILLNEAEIIIREKISASFYIKETRVSLDDLTVKIVGVQKKWVGSRPLPDKSITYFVKFSLDYGSIGLDGIVDVRDSKR